MSTETTDEQQDVTPREVVTSPRADGGPEQQENEFTATRHVYEPHVVGLPKIGPYVRELWRRREFAAELSRTKLRSQHFNTVFGQLWLVLNPLLLGLVYFILVDILRSGTRGAPFFAHLLAGIFAYYFVSGSVREAAKSVTSGGRLVLNTAFPRLLLPLASVITGFKRFIPTFLVYIPVHLIVGLPVDWELFWVIPLIALLAGVAAGLSMFVAAIQVYFRDLKQFLPYALRIWLYVCPILYYADEVPDKYKPILDVNPLGGILTAWSDVLNGGRSPHAGDLLLGLAWAAGLFVVGALFFMSREREFAVRL
jgi:teichoic acid transport system permease protein